MIHAVTMPKWGIEMTEGTLTAWTVREGQVVTKGEPILEVETDKIINTVEAPAAGVLRRITAEAGEVRPVGALIAVLADESVSDADVAGFVESFQGASVCFEPDGEGSGADRQDGSGANGRGSVGAVGGSGSGGDEFGAGGEVGRAGGSGESGGGVGASGEPGHARVGGIDGSDSAGDGASGGSAAAIGPAGGEAEGGEPRVSPVARRLADKLGIDVSQIQGTGRNGRVSKEDVEAHAAKLAAASNANPQTRIRMSATRATIARRLAESKSTIPHYRVEIDVDVGKLQAHRKQFAAKVSLNDMLVYCTARALAQHPQLNAHLDGDEIVQFARADIAVAVATTAGLITPVVRDVAAKSPEEVARIIGDLSERARRGALLREEISDGTFSISNLGMYGLSRFDAIINPPQVAILAVGTAQDRVVARNGAPVIAQMLTLTLSADHRVVDGAVAAAFLATLREIIEA